MFLRMLAHPLLQVKVETYHCCLEIVKVGCFGFCLFFFVEGEALTVDYLIITLKLRIITIKIDGNFSSTLKNLYYCIRAMCVCVF